MLRKLPTHLLNNLNLRRTASQKRPERAVFSLNGGNIK